MCSAMRICFVSVLVLAWCQRLLAVLACAVFLARIECSRVKRVPQHVSAEIVVLAGGVIPLAPPVPASTRISARLTQFTCDTKLRIRLQAESCFFLLEMPRSR